ncbi:hypothetical protein ACFFVF_02860 [Flavobacterium jumunjinense]|uniref:Lipoprotein n=2 Tax=Flavobacteriaceae TaxID=49546 RepID=A0ABV5GJA7_9FLAO
MTGNRPQSATFHTDNVMRQAQSRTLKMKINLIILFLIFLSSCTDKSSTKESLDNNKKQVLETSLAFENSKDSLITLLPEMKSNSLDCNANIYWRIIKRGKTSIPLLIESLTDTTMTNVYSNCKNGKLNVGEISYFALEEIAEFPAFAVTNIQFDVIDKNGCWSFFDYLFDNRNKKQYQKMARDFYKSNEYAYEKFDKKELKECRKKYQIEGKLRWEK